MSYLDPQSWDDVDSAGNPLDWDSRENKLWYPAYEMLKRACNERGYWGGLYAPGAITIDKWYATRNYNQWAAVEYQGNLYKSKKDDNEGNIPDALNSLWWDIDNSIWPARSTEKIYLRGPAFSGWMKRLCDAYAYITQRDIWGTGEHLQPFTYFVDYRLTDIHGNSHSPVPRLLNTIDEIVPLIVDRSFDSVIQRRPQARYSKYFYDLLNVARIVMSYSFLYSSNSVITKKKSYIKDSGQAHATFNNALAAYNSAPWVEVSTSFDTAMHYVQYSNNPTEGWRVFRQAVEYHIIPPFLNFNFLLAFYTSFFRIGISVFSIYENNDYPGVEILTWRNLFADTAPRSFAPFYSVEIGKINACTCTPPEIIGDVQTNGWMLENKLAFFDYNCPGGFKFLAPPPVP